MNHINKIRISKGFMKNDLIPTYKLLVSYQKLKLSSLSNLKDYIYGKHIEINGYPVKDIWDSLPLLQSGASCTFANPNEHQERHYAKGTYNSLLSMSLPSLASCNTFEDLYDIINNTFFSGKFPNAFLTSYDMALRIGYNMSPQILPKECVYLAAGAYLGAESLFGKSWISKNEDKSFPQRKPNKFARVKRDRFFYIQNGKRIDYFNGLSSAEVEDMLCIFFNV